MSSAGESKGGDEAAPATMTLKVPPQHLELFMTAIAWKLDADAERLREAERELREALFRDRKGEPLAKRELREGREWLASSARLLASAHDHAESQSGAEIALSAAAEELLATLEAMAREVIVPRLASLVDLGPIPIEATLELNAALAWALEQAGTMERAADGECGLRDGEAGGEVRGSAAGQHTTALGNV